MVRAQRRLCPRNWCKWCNIYWWAERKVRGELHFLTLSVSFFVCLKISDFKATTFAMNVNSASQDAHHLRELRDLWTCWLLNALRLLWQVEQLDEQVDGARCHFVNCELLTCFRLPVQSKISKNFYHPWTFLRYIKKCSEQKNTHFQKSATLAQKVLISKKCLKSAQKQKTLHGLSTTHIIRRCCK